MSDDAKPPKPSPGLPPSGLADEILSKLARGELALDSAEEPREPTTEATGVDRIYTFTDSLQLGDEEQEEREIFETWVEFELGGDPFALPVAQVQEILRCGELTPVPQPPFSVLGVFNLRGRVVPLLDLRVRLGLPARATDAESRIVVVESDARRIGLLVDTVARITQLAESAIRPADGEAEMGEVRCLHAAEGRELRLLDLAAILNLPEREETQADSGPLGD